MLDFFKKIFGKKQEQEVGNNEPVSEEKDFEASSEESSEEISSSSEKSEEDSESIEGEEKK